MQYSEEMIEHVSFVIRGKNRHRIMNLLVDGIKTQNDIIGETEISREGVSPILKELIEENLVECINPEVKKGKIYQITDLGTETMEIIFKNGY